MTGTPKAKKPPAMLPPATKTEEISAEAAKAGVEERLRLRRRQGRQATQITTPGFMVPAKVERKRLKTTLG